MNGPRPPSRSASITHSRSTSKASPTAASSTAGARSHSPRPSGTGLERRPSISSYPHAHNRQTSIVNGGIQHSRNSSFVNSPATSPLSPQLVNGIPRDQMAHYLPSPPLPLSNGSENQGMSINGVINIDLPRMTSPPEPSRTNPGHQKTKSHHHSHSHHHNNEPKTPAEYALHILFTQFVRLAEAKINSCLAHPLESEPNIEEICGAGVDPAFDKLIGSLGYIARHKPRPVIDSVMFWRKSKSEAANAARSELKQQQGRGAPMTTPHARHPDAFASLIRRNNDSQSTDSFQYGSISNNAPANYTGVSHQRENSAIADRRSTIAIYILCRVLIEVIGQTTLQSITEEMADKLEDIIFNQLRSADPDILNSSPLRMGNWTLFAQLLGVMSEIHFESVSDRLFLSDLEKTGKGFVSKEQEPKVELVIRGMSYLKLKLYPPEAFEEGCEFMVLLTKLFLTAQGQRIKYAYCDLYTKLLLPIAAQGETELNMPRWVEFIQQLYPRLLEMCTKQKHWDVAFPLLGTLLCATPWEFFTSTWLPILESNATKLKDRSLRTMIVQIAGRLVWTYLFRCTETLNVTIKKLEIVIKLFFPPGRRSLLLGADQDLMEAYIQLIRFIGYKHQDFCFRNVISQLLNADSLLAFNSTSVDLLSPERMIVGIRSFLAIMNDLERQELKPPFPTKFESSQAETDPPISTWLMKFDSEKSEAMKKLDRMSRPVQLERLGPTAKEYYEKFGDILGRIIWVCDTNFGGKALLEERFNHVQPKTPVTATFSFNLDHPSGDQRQAYYDLLNVTFSALPRCLPPNITFTKLVEILCHGTAHVDHKVATGAANALKCIARQSSQRQRVIIGFARFIFDFDSRYATTSDAGMLGATHIENTLKLYVELLRIWIEAIKQKTKIVPSAMDQEMGLTINDVPSKMDDLEISNVRTVVDEIESHGLFFLSSCSRTVRKFALMVLRLITEFDNALKEEVENRYKKKEPKPDYEDPQQFTRIIHILEYDSLNVMNQNVNDDKWSVADRSRLRRELFESKSQDALIDLASSDNQYDSSLWFKLFPKLIRVCFEKFPLTVVQCRDTVCGRLAQMQSQIQTVALEPPKQAGFDNVAQKPGIKTSLTSPEGIINQWKIYLIVACSTLTLTNQETRPETPSLQHTRKVSKGNSSNSSTSMDRIISGRSLFSMILPLLGSENQTIRDAVVSGLGSININLYKTLLESLQPFVSKWNDGAQSRNHRAANGGPNVRRSKKEYRLRTEITHVMQLTSYFLQQPEVYNDVWILQHKVAFLKDMKTFLSEPDIRDDSDYVKLRRYFCGLTEELFEGINKTPNPERWLPFDGRRSLFNLIELWCGKNGNWPQNTTSASIEIEKNDLKTAALSAMAALCAGPIFSVIENKSTVTFDVGSLFQWLEYVFNESSDRLHRVGRKALKNLLVHNRGMPQLLGLAMKSCYLYRTTTKGVESYFAVVSDLLINEPDYPCGLYKSLALALFKIGDENHRVRSKAATLLRVTEERYFKTTTVLDYEVSIADKTAAVYKRAQFELSKSMSNLHPEEAFLMISEFTMFFNLVDSKSQRDILAVLLPWIQMIELQQDPNGGPSAWSYMVLANLFEITVKFSGKIHNEVEGLWKALASASYNGNVKVVLDFIIAQSLERKEQNFVNYGKQIIVCLAGTVNGAKLVEALMAYLQPKLMSITQVEPYNIPDKAMYPYIADLSESLPLGGKQGFSRGQLGLILMVDLLVGPVPEMAPNLPLLLQVVFILWDHYVPLVQEQAREMLGHLIHELIISKMNKDSAPAVRASSREFVETIRARKPKTHWAYDDVGSSEDGARIPKSMGQMVSEVLQIFEADFPYLRERWGKIAVQWATNCPVRHLACRSFQVFRCLLPELDQAMLSDMLGRLSNTIADNSTDIQSFSMEILITLNSITEQLTQEGLLDFPQLFWCTVACLYTIHEKEFMEVLLLLQKLLNKLDLDVKETVTFLLSMYPANWEGKFEGIQALIVKGVRSSVSLARTLEVLDKLSVLPSNELIGDSNRLLYTLLANLPRFLEGADDKEFGPPQTTIKAAESMLVMCKNDNHLEIARVLSLYTGMRFRSKDSFRTQIVSAIKETFFPQWEAPALIFLVGMLSNNLKWFKLRVMELLTAILPLIDMRKPEFAGVGADLISPLLRLLQTEYCQQALEVLDKVILISGGKMDRQVMRMSMGNRTLRKEYERTETLFGIPEDSGWAIPMPAIMASTTRANVHEVFYTCQMPSPPKDTNPTPDLQFQVDDYAYTSFADRTATMLSEDARGEGGLGDMVVRLENLDSFFADEAFNGSQPPPTDTESVHDGVESAPHLYDSRVYAILNHSLHRSASVTSFRNTFSDSLSTPAPRDQQPPPIMTPTVFTAPPLPMMGRGGIPNRGVMSPDYAQLGRPASESSSDDEYEDDASGDDDDASPNMSKDDSPFNLENLLKSAGQKAKSGMENVRNLRRNREKEKEEKDKDKDKERDELN